MVLQNKVGYLDGCEQLGNKHPRAACAEHPSQNAVAVVDKHGGHLPCHTCKGHEDVSGHPHNKKNTQCVSIRETKSLVFIITHKTWSDFWRKTTRVMNMQCHDVNGNKFCNEKHMPPMRPLFEHRNPAQSGINVPT